MGSLVAALAFAGAARSLAPADGAISIGLTIAVGLAIVLTFVIGAWASGRAERSFGRHDDGRIVVDEVVGQWIALTPIVPFASRLDSFSFGAAVVTGFVAFRLFDIWKPGAVGWAERRFEGGIGVMADDVVAGVYGALFGVLPAVFLLRDAGMTLSMSLSLSMPGAPDLFAGASVGPFASAGAGMRIGSASLRIGSEALA